MKKIYEQYMYAYPHKTSYYPLKKQEVEEALRGISGKTSGLYLHVPFCRTKCGYCNLFSVAGQDEMIPVYLEAVKRQVKQYGETVDFRTISFDSLTIGGGTPVKLTIAQLEDILSFLADSCGVNAETSQWGIELSPEDTAGDIVDYLKAVGFARVSIGVQSFQERELAAIGRRHSLERCAGVLKLLEQADFPSWNVDLIYGIPGQDVESLKGSIQAALQYHPKEIFLYPLYIKPGTGLQGRCSTAEETALELYRRGADFLKEQGYHQISMRRFALYPQAERSCGFEQNLAVGCGGRSYLGNLHVCEPFTVGAENCRRQLQRFCEKQDFFRDVVGSILNLDEQKRRYAVKNLLHVQGISRQEFQSLFQRDVLEEFIFLKELHMSGHVTVTGDRVYLSEEGLAWSDGIGPMFISPSVRQRSQMFYERNGIL